jgi:hypothetical protein
VQSGGPERPDAAGLGGGAIGVGRRGVDERADKPGKWAGRLGRVGRIRRNNSFRIKIGF